jgi:hypothetical protein
MRGERSGKIAWNGLNNQEFRSFLEATMAVCAVAKYSSCTRRYIQLHSPVLEAPRSPAPPLHMSRSRSIILPALKLLLSLGPFSCGVQVRCSAVLNHPQIDIKSVRLEGKALGLPSVAQMTGRRKEVNHAKARKENGIGRDDSPRVGGNRVK